MIGSHVKWSNVRIGFSGLEQRNGGKVKGLAGPEQQRVGREQVGQGVG